LNTKGTGKSICVTMSIMKGSGRR